MKSSDKYKHILAQANLVNLQIKQVFDYYHQCFLHEPKWAEILAESNNIPAKLKHNLFIGVCDRTYGKHIPKAKTIEGGAIRGRLMRLGLILPSGGERFRGCLVFPKIEQGLIVSATGYRYASRIRIWQQRIVNWHKPAEEEFIKIGMYAVRGMLDE